MQARFYVFYFMCAFPLVFIVIPYGWYSIAGIGMQIAGIVGMLFFSKAAK